MKLISNATSSVTVLETGEEAMYIGTTPADELFEEEEFINVNLKEEVLNPTESSPEVPGWNIGPLSVIIAVACVILFCVGLSFFINRRDPGRRILPNFRLKLKCCHRVRSQPQLDEGLIQAEQF
ncbi:unnamed protein product [Clavelina lepadiformis]|uniref:Uncharacterized protein n=1 Tax=Clavelina lepadiformis TaxID=159417 RepID=A0ABP0GE99_CLALP